MAPKHLFRDPDLIPRSKHGAEGDLGQVGSWPVSERQRMDRQFINAMLRAGYSTTMASTHFGTIRPVRGYQRSD
jgi:hypothetical protein